VSKLVRGDQLPSNLRREVLSAYVHRWTSDNPQRSSAWRGIQGAPTIPLVSDAQWLREHAFYVTDRGTLDKRKKHAEPAYLIETEKHHATKKGHAAGAREYQYRAIVGGKGILLGGVKRHASSWFKTKKEADDWAWAIHEGNQSVGRTVDYVTIERKHGGVVEHVPWAHAGEMEV